MFVQVDETICIICGGSTYVGETISCETCLRWFHFQCVGVSFTHLLGLYLFHMMFLIIKIYYDKSLHLESLKSKLS